MPNIAYIVDCYHRNICGDDWRSENPEADPMKWVNGRIFTYGPGEENRHRACFDECYRHRSLEQAGFRNVQRVSKRILGIGHGPIDLGMRGANPERSEE